MNSKFAVYDVEGLQLMAIFGQRDADAFLSQVVRVLAEECNISNIWG